MSASFHVQEGSWNELRRNLEETEMDSGRALGKQCFLKPRQNFFLDFVVYLKLSDIWSWTNQLKDLLVFQFRSHMFARSWYLIKDPLTSTWSNPSYALEYFCGTSTRQMLLTKSSNQRYKTCVRQKTRPLDPKVSTFSCLFWPFSVKASTHVRFWWTRALTIDNVWDKCPLKDINALNRLRAKARQHSWLVARNIFLNRA